MGKALITPPLPEELWFRLREIQTKEITCTLDITIKSGKVVKWTTSIPEEPSSGRQDIRLQKK
jgi:hypothetical protein